MRGEIPVTILCGNLGAGKTTLLNHLLRNAGDRDVAVLINDMGEVNVDADLVAENSDLDVTGGVTELSNGCICCELQDDLESAVVRLAGDYDFDNLVVEASGISEPEPVARLFTAGRAAARYTVDAVVAVVDSRLFLDTFAGTGTPEKSEVEDGEEVRPLSDLLVEQVEFADAVLLNKVDLCTDAELDEAEELVRALRPDARIYRTERSAVDPDELLDLGLFDPAAAAERAGWQVALDEADAQEAAGSGGHDDHGEGHKEDHDGHGEGHGHDDHDGAHHGHQHPDEAYGVTSFTYRRRRPFHPERVAAVLGDLPEGVVRSKGALWVAGRELKEVLGQAGPSAHVEATGPWIASLSEADQKLYRSNRKDLDWDEEWGDHLTELVFIGTDYDEGTIRERLDDALLTDAEMAADWDAFENPFPDEAGVEVRLASPTPASDGGREEP